MKLVQAGLCGGETVYKPFNCQGGVVKHVHTCLSDKGRESSFNHCGGPVKLVHA